MHSSSCVLVIAGSDSFGEAGVQSDIKTITVLGSFPTTAITVLTAPLKAGGRSIIEVSASFIEEQICSVLENFSVKAIKIGMLPSSKIIETVGSILSRYESIPVILDPVCICASQGKQTFLQEDALKAMQEVLFKRAILLTPNCLEAELLSGIIVEKMSDLQESMNSFFEKGAKSVLIKGARASEENTLFYRNKETIVDYFCSATEKEDIKVFSHKRIHTPNTHGTGCMLSSAIATYISQGNTLIKSILSAQDFLLSCLEESANMKHNGHGSPNHLAGITIKKQ